MVQDEGVRKPHEGATIPGTSRSVALLLIRATVKDLANLEPGGTLHHELDLDDTVPENSRNSVRPPG
jgi:hypothetical protein